MEGPLGFLDVSLQAELAINPNGHEAVRLLQSLSEPGPDVKVSD